MQSKHRKKQIIMGNLHKYNPTFTDISHTEKDLKLARTSTSELGVNQLYQHHQVIPDSYSIYKKVMDKKNIKEDNR